MSYADTKCPCGGKKEPSTMLCEDCESAFADRPEMETLKDQQRSIPARRQAAIILLALSRKRKRI